VIRLAREWFTYLSACKAPVEVVRGDARLSMENEPPQNYDLLVLDAFTSDAVPVHLLTREAFETCLRHLAPGGVIATHVSTHHLDLQALIWRQATSLGLETAWIVDSGDANQGEMTSDWMLLARDRRFFDTPEVVAASSQPKLEWAGVDPWTDDRVNPPAGPAGPYRRAGGHVE